MTGVSVIKVSSGGASSARRSSFFPLFSEGTRSSARRSAWFDSFSSVPCFWLGPTVFSVAFRAAPAPQPVAPTSFIASARFPSSAGVSSFLDLFPSDPRLVDSVLLVLRLLLFRLPLFGRCFIVLRRLVVRLPLLGASPPVLRSLFARPLLLYRRFRYQRVLG